mgnify:CR=1 FL=1
MLQAPVLQNIVQVIIEHQQDIIGPLALVQASKVPGIKIESGNKIEVMLTQNNPEIILSNLVKQYEELFGLASIEVCTDAVKEMKPSVSPNELPEILR